MGQNFEWGLIFAFLGMLLATVIVPYALQRWRRSKEQRPRGFRTAKSPAERARDRARRNFPGQ